MRGIQEMFEELSGWERGDDYEFSYSAYRTLERRKEITNIWKALHPEKVRAHYHKWRAANKEQERERARKRRATLDRDIERIKWNNRDKKRRATDPDYAEARRAGVRERMRKLRAARKLQGNS